jgi:hypothetical protein
MKGNTIMDICKDDVLAFLEKFATTEYKKGYKQGECDALIAIEKWYRAEYNDSNLCIQSLMEWDDDGCCLDCIECIKNHCT